MPAPEADLPAALARAPRTIDCDGRWITPGLIDCHTHLVYAGDRAQRIRAAAGRRDLRGDRARRRRHRLDGQGDCARRARTSWCARALPRLDALIAEGVTTVEIKSGYGLDLDERAQVAARRAPLGERARRSTSRTTFLGAHALPPEAGGDKDGYHRPGRATRCCRRSPREGLADAVDGFCEGIAFSPDEIARVFEAAQALGPAGEAARRPALQPARRGARRAASARSRPTISNIPTRPAPRRWRRPGTVAVLLPGAFYFIRETQAAAGRRCSAGTACRSRSPPTAIPAPRR